jgi:hypothetical protein
MTIHDAMADVFLRAILKNPEKFPVGLREAAKHHWQIWRYAWDEIDNTTDTRRRYAGGSFIAFKTALSASVQDLPALMENEK